MAVRGTYGDYSHDDIHVITRPDSTFERHYLVNITAKPCQMGNWAAAAGSVNPAYS